ncbi:sigma-70 family RNA polymerase sigma factor [Candidatus Peregrinibacteria bacterium]|nr:sigma-70 family RNA polymerase sigma factor [Candidatus Peregrinibacteria bacterium]
MGTELEKERQLIEAAKQDPKLFAEVYDRYVEQIYRYIFRRVNDVDTTEDLVSQTFFDALSHLNGYTFRGFPFSSWLYKIAHNNVLKWYRQNSKAKKIDLDEIAELKAREDVQENVEVAENKIEIMTALEGMDYENKEIIRLKYFEEVTNIEIAQIMGISANNVGVKLYRALKKLKNIMKSNE